MDTPITDDAADFPEYFERWENGHKLVRAELCARFEELLNEAREHIETYDDGMAGWKEKTDKILRRYS